MAGGSKAKARPSSGKGQKQATMFQAFEKGNTQVAAMPILEKTAALGTPIDNYHAVNIENTLNHHLSELKRKRRWIPSASEILTQGRASRRRLAAVDEDEYVNPMEDLEAEDRDLSLGDEDAYRLLCQLEELIDANTIPTMKQLHCVVNIMRCHGLHGRRDLSSGAFSLMQRISKMFPAVSLKHTEGPEPTPYVLVNSNAWSLLGCCEAFSEDQFEDVEEGKKVLPFKILARLVRLAHEAVCPLKPGVKPPARDVATTAGDLFLFKWVVGELQTDLDCRLEVFAASQSLKGVNANHKTMRDRRSALLQNSQLWRTFSDAAVKTFDCDRKALINSLMEIVAAPAEPELVNQCATMEQAAFNPGELAQIAAQLLRLLLELYGTAEEAKMFQKYGSSRATTTGTLDNVRMVIENAMVDGVVGSNQVLRTLPQKSAFLLALHSKDRMRLLHMIVALRHAQRVKDGAKYPSLESFSDLYKNQGDVGSYLRAAPQEALQYILDDFQLAYNLVDKTADGLALLVSCLCQAAASELTGSDLEVLGELLEKIVSSFSKHASTAGSQSKTKTLSPSSLLSLRAAQCCVQPLAVA